MKVKLLVLIVLVVLVGGGFAAMKVFDKPEPKKSNYFKSDLSKIRIDDGEKF